MLEAMLYVLRTGIPWRDMPSLFGPWASVYTRWRRWCQCGLWTRMLKLLTSQAVGQLRFLDASHIKIHQDASNPAGGQQNQAFGRTKGGLNTKLTAWVDAAGRALQLSLAAGNRADVQVAAQEAWPRGLRGKKVVADKGYDSDAFRLQIHGQRAKSCIPPRSCRLKPAPWNRGFYRHRHHVENFFQRIKRYRRIGTRYEKTDLCFLGFVYLAAVLDWLN